MDRFAGMQSDAHLHVLDRMFSVVVVESALNTDGALDGFARGLECRHETITGRFDFATAMISKLLTHDLVVCVHYFVGVRLTLMLAQARRTNDISEHHGHGCRLGHCLCAYPRCSWS